MWDYPRHRILLILFYLRKIKENICGVCQLSWCAGGERPHGSSTWPAKLDWDTLQPQIWQDGTNYCKNVWLNGKHYTKNLKQWCKLARRVIGKNGKSQLNVLNQKNVRYLESAKARHGGYASTTSEGHWEFERRVDKDSDGKAFE